MDLYVGLFAFMDYLNYVGIIISNYLVICWYFNLQAYFIAERINENTHVNQGQSRQSILIGYNSRA